jgi:probable HAF family extracellular repeat protein
MATSISRALPCGHKSLVVACTLILSSTLIVPKANSAPKFATQFAVVPLGTLDNPGSSTVLRRVNSLGEAVKSFKSKNPHQASAAFIVSIAAGLDEITSEQATDFSALYGINDTGEVAGAINGPSSVLPFRAVRHTGFQLLPLLDQDTSGAAYGINDSGESVGFSGGTDGVRAVWWTRKGEVTGLPSLPNFTTTKALDINKKGDIVGYAGEADKVAVLWPSKGNIIPLDNLSTYTSSQAEGISDSGDIVGYASAFDPTAVRLRAVLWPAGSITPRDLGVLPGGSTSRARQVDTNGVVVGTSDSSVGNRAFIWTADTGMRDLNSLSTNPAIILVDALSINKQGAILAIGISTSDLPSGDSKDAEEHELPRQIVLLTPLN